MKESEVSLGIRLDLGSRPDTRLFRNNVGTFLQVSGGTVKSATSVLAKYGILARFVTVGFCPGSSDLIGWHTVTVTPEMVGSPVAIFTAIESKRPGHRTDPKRLESQMKFIDTVLRFGGRAGIAESVDQARAIVLDQF